MNNTVTLYIFGIVALFTDNTHAGDGASRAPAQHVMTVTISNKAEINKRTKHLAEDLAHFFEARELSNFAGQTITTRTMADKIDGHIEAYHLSQASKDKMPLGAAQVTMFIRNHRPLIYWVLLGDQHEALRAMDCDPTTSKQESKQKES